MTATAYYSDDHCTLHHGQALEVLRALPDGAVNCCVTSPPYFGLRDYGVAGQIGAEASPAEFVSALAAVFREARRVLSDDGTLWLNLGDSYSGGNRTTYDTKGSGAVTPRVDATRPVTGIAGKNLLGIPWRVAFALQDDGWILRNDIIWSKPNAMPESVTDRLSTKHEHLFLFSKSRHYWFDLDPIREPLTYPEAADGSRVFGGTNKAASLTTGSSERRAGSVYGKAAGTNLQPTGRQHLTSEANGGRNPGDVWTIPTQPFSEAHFAVFPVEIPRRAIAAGCKPGGTVLDPFSGSGTTGLAAAELGRRYVGIDLNRDYLDLSLRTRLAQPSLTTEAAGETWEVSRA